MLIGDDGDKSHYTIVKCMSRLLQGQAIKKKCRRFYCNNCLNGFTSEKTLQNHVIHCDDCVIDECKLKPRAWKRNLELDLYNDSLKLGIEYNGIQHYEYTKRFHKTYSDFRRQQERDALKKQLCKENEVTLIVVPYNMDCIPSYLLRRARRLFPERFTTPKV